MNWNRTLEVIRKEFLQAFREPRMRFTLIVPPLIQTIVFGFAVNLDVEHAKLAWLDRDHSAASRDLYHAFTASRYFDVTEYPESEAELTDLLDRGDVVAAVVMLPGFAEEIARGRTAPVQFLVDGSNSNTASVVLSYARRIVQDFSRERRVAPYRATLVARLSPADVELESRVWFNPNLLSRNYFIPGVIANILGLITLMLTAMGIVREKEIGTMEQLMVTPIRPSELIVGKTLPFALVGLLDVVAMTGLAWVIFDVRLEGSLWLLLACSAVYLLTTLGFGILISTLARTQQQAVMSTFFVFLPLFLLSGFAFPIGSMPRPVQILTLINPVRYFMTIVRALFLKGVGLEAIWPQMLALAVIGATILLISVARFRKRLD